MLKLLTRIYIGVLLTLWVLSLPRLYREAKSKLNSQQEK